MYFSCHAYLDKISSDNRELSLRAWQPNGFDDEVASRKLWVQHQMVGHRACAAEGEHMAVLKESK